MDAQGRLTEIEEFRIGQLYYWVKAVKGPCAGRTHLGPFLLKAIRREKVPYDTSPYLVFERNGKETRTYCWRRRYAPAWKIAADALAVPTKSGRLVSHDDWLKLRRHINSRRKPRYGDCCAKCEFFDPALDYCRNEKNFSAPYTFRTVYPNSWCQWYEKAIRA